MGVYSIELFFKQYFGNLILMCNIAVSSTCSPVVCSFSSFWLMIFGERRSFTVLQYHFICTLPSKTVNKAPLGFFSEGLP